MVKQTRREALVAASAVVAGLAAGASARASGDDDGVLIPAGPFLFGSEPSEAAAAARRYGFHRSWTEPETPRRTIDLPAFAIDRYPVTNADYHVFCRATGYAPRGHWQGPTPQPGTERRPVVMVSRIDAQAYAAWAGKRLPTEEEWEKAARGRDGRTYPWGSRFLPDRCCWNRDRAGAFVETRPVDAFPKGASPYGVMDMAGNVAEWTSSSPGAGSGILKGGCWMTQSPLNLRIAARGMSGFDNNQSLFIGFRCVREVK
jgi:formylglycine-generating enzyme required for sulfatase activity